MTIRTQLKTGGWMNHNEALRVRSTVKAGGWFNHNEALRVRLSMKAGGVNLQHNEALNVRWPAKVTGLRQMLKTTADKSDRLELLVVRAGVRAGGRVLRGARACK
jgi:hypothetical protein